ncbi:hypothetical protein [Nonomuraea sp. NPDC049400]|uniref:hypothetical protein n=1 Tax=Nonomuraea sp. NPDC049400 TaxID=3364352 RepID=UPI00378E3321
MSVRVVAALTAGFLALAACSAEEPKQEQKAGTIRIFAQQNADQHLSKSPFTKRLQQKLGVTLTFETTTWDSASAKEKRQISLASGDLPDVYVLIPWVDGFTQSELIRLGKQGVVVPLNDLIDKHAPNVKKTLDSIPDFKRLATAPDGKIYGMPQWNDCFHCSYAAKLWMNSAWLKKLGLKQPTTPDELREVLQAFKTKDPNGNGKADEIPMSASTANPLLPYLMNAFIYDPQGSPDYGSTLAVNAGKVQLQPMQPGWREGLRYIAGLYKDGLIDQAAFTQNGDAMKAKGDKAGASIVGSATVMHPAQLVTIGQKDRRDRDYDAVAPLTGPSGTQYATYTLPSLPGGTFVLTSKASEATQIAAIKMLDYIFTEEGHRYGEFGEEGVGWEKAGPGDVALDESLKPSFKTLTQPEGVEGGWGPAAQYNSTKEFRNAQVASTHIYDQAGYERRLFKATELYAGKEPKDQIFPVWHIKIAPEQAGELATLQTNIDNYVNQSSLQFVTGQKNINDDAAWQAFLDGLNGLGVTRYLQIQQKAYDAL